MWAAIGATVVIAVLTPGVAAAKTPPEAWAKESLDATRTLKSVRGSIRLVSSGASTNGVVVDADADYANQVGHGSSGPLEEPHQLEFITNGESSWISSEESAFTDELPAGVSFVAVPTTDLERTGSISFDPETLIGALYAMLGAEDTNVAPVNGGRRYAFDVDLAQAAENLPEDWRPGFQRVYGEVSPEAIEHATGRVVVDDENRVRSAKFVFEADGDAVGALQDSALRITIKLSHYDEPVTATPPPANQVVDVSAVPGIQALLGLN